MDPSQPSTQRPHPSRARRRDTLAFYACISPWLIGLIVFVLGPVLASLALGFTRWDLIGPVRYVGLANYRRMAGRDPLFFQSLRVTLTYTALYLPAEIVGGLALGMLLHQQVRGIRVLRAIYYLPSVLPGVAFVVVWMWLLHPSAGLVNLFLSWVGIRGPRWLVDPDWALPALWLMSLWGLGRTAIIYLAGLQTISRELYEAGIVDGAGPWHLFWRITLPMLTPTIFFTVVLGIIGTFQTFTSAYVATDGGPLNATLFYVLYLYRQAFQYFAMGYAAALAWVLFTIILVLTMVLVRSADRWVYYEGART